jgi:hypothetical protein
MKKLIIGTSLAVALAIALEVVGGHEILPPAYAEQLKILESQLNKHSITGVLQNPYDYRIGGIVVTAEFHNNDGSLIGVRNFGYPTKNELKPGEKSPFKIPDLGKVFPKTNFILAAEGTDFTNMVVVSGDEMIAQVEKLGKALDNLSKEVVINVTKNVNLISQNVSSQNVSR